MFLSCSFPSLDGSLEMPKDELPNHNCIKHLRSVVQQQQTRIAELEKTSAEHKHQLAEQVGHVHVPACLWVRGISMSSGSVPVPANLGQRVLCLCVAANHPGALLSSLHPISGIQPPDVYLYQMPSLEGTLLSTRDRAGDDTVVSLSS